MLSNILKMDRCHNFYSPDILVLVDMSDILIKRGTCAVGVTFPFMGYKGVQIGFTQYSENG